MAIRQAMLRGARNWTRKGWRGGWLVINAMRQLGLLQAPLRIQLEGGAAVTLPVAIVPDYYDAIDLQVYEANSVALFRRTVRDLPRPRYLVEAGGHVGILSVRLLQDGLFDGGWVIEPNPELFPHLAENTSPYGVHSIHAAVADFRGRGRLVNPPEDGAATAAFLEPEEQGPISVIRLDDLGVPAAKATVAIKLDIEGGELAALQGAVRTMTLARNLLVVFEAHSGVCQRTGIDPVEIMQYLGSIRPMKFTVAERPEFEVKTDRGFFRQVPPGVYNILARPA